MKNMKWVMGMWGYEDKGVSVEVHLQLKSEK
jgi:hypothetical protein